MVRFQRSALARIGFFPEAAKFAQEIAGHVGRRHGVEISTYADSAGTIYWISDYPDYAAFGKVRQDLTADKRYWQMIKKAQEIFVDGSVRDVVITPL